MKEYIYKRIPELETPIGNIKVIGKGAEVPFSVRKNDYDADYHIGVPGELFGKVLRTDSNFALDIDVSDLAVGEEYKIVFTGAPLSYYDSDEGAVALCACDGGYAIGIGGYDPNETEALRQDMEYSASVGKVILGEFESAPEYDLSKFKHYVIDRSSDGTGFTFTLLDKSFRRVTFLVAWISCRGITEGIATDAVSFWVV